VLGLDMVRWTHRLQRQVDSATTDLHAVLVRLQTTNYTEMITYNVLPALA
jgi:hypothetical protein